MSFEFDRAIQLEPLGNDGHGRRFRGHISRDFWIVRGPNGGYLAALALHAASLAQRDPARTPRSLHVRYLAAPEAGECELQTTIVREGRALTILGMSLRQGDRELLSASACFSAAHPGPEFQDRAAPKPIALESAAPLNKVLPINHRFDSRSAIGGAPRAGTRAETGGYMRFADGRPIDTLALAAMWDTWPPAVFFRTTEPALSGAVPTLEASVYFRRPLPFAGFRDSDYIVTHIRSAMAHDGFIEEDADLWSLDGQLLVQSRQLALCR